MPHVTHTFRWPSTVPAEVFVTGTFDNWSKSVQLERGPTGFEKAVKLSTEKSILYKFVVDDVWTTDPSLPLEEDQDKNSNNILSSDSLSALMTSSAPDSTPSAAPVGAATTSEQDTVSEVPAVTTDASKDGLSEAEPGNGLPTNPTATVDGDQTVSVDPLPAAIGNKPPALTASIGDHVDLSEAGYNAPDKLAEEELVAIAAGKAAATSEAPAEEHNKSTEESNAETGDVKTDDVETGDVVSVNPLPASQDNKPPAQSTAAVDEHVTLTEEAYNAPDTIAQEQIAESRPKDGPAATTTDGEIVSVKPIAGTDDNSNLPPVSSADAVNNNVTTGQEAYDGFTDSTAAKAFKPETKKEQTQEVTPAEVTIQSAAPESSAAALAAGVPREPERKAEVVPTAEPEEHTPVAATSSDDVGILPVPTTTGSFADDATRAILSSSVAPASTTAELAAKVPVEDTTATAAADEAPAVEAEAPPAVTASVADTAATASETPKKRKPWLFSWILTWLRSRFPWARSAQAAE